LSQWKKPSFSDEVSSSYNSAEHAARLFEDVADRAAHSEVEAHIEWKYNEEPKYPVKIILDHKRASGRRVLQPGQSARQHAACSEYHRKNKVDDNRQRRYISKGSHGTTSHLMVRCLWLHKLLNGISSLDWSTEYAVVQNNPVRRIRALTTTSV